MKKVLIITLSSGECERDYCLRSLQRQTYRDAAFLEIAGLGSHAAHERLYQTIHAESGRYDYFLKLDADMIFRSDDSLESMIAETAAIPDCDHATWPVLDFLSETPIPGIHLFSSRARWNLPLPPLFVDPNPMIPGRRIAWPKNHPCPVLHAPFPSRRQAFQFGVHRGLKCFAGNGSGGNAVMRLFQFELLCAVWSMFLRTQDRTRGMTMLGAEWARRHPQADAAEYRRDPEVAAHFEAVQNSSFAAIRAACAGFWSHRRAVVHLRRWIDVKLAKYT